MKALKRFRFLILLRLKFRENKSTGSYRGNRTSWTGRPSVDDNFRMHLGPEHLGQNSVKRNIRNM